MRPKLTLMLFCISALLALRLAGRAPGEFSPPSRTFLFTYQVTLKNLPAGAQRVRLWIPCAVTDTNQTVVLKKVNGPVHLRQTQEAPFGNHILYGEILHPPSGPAEFTIEYQVTRQEYSKGNYENLVKASRGPEAAPKYLARFLEPDRLVPIDGRIKELADENTRGKLNTVEKAHGLYDYVFQTVRYDKSGTGWGRGDSRWVCDSKHGNCTDFHSLFISLARAEGIPARFEIGFPVPDGTEGIIPGYHCWAEFFVNGVGWVPVDISEAWKDPKKHDYFFGTLDAHRVQFSVGRDLMLQPKQDGGPLNYFIYPYVEVDGKPFEGIEKKFSYREAATPPGVTG
jgi:transglutaminase-like putative cysteine protease